MLERKSVFYKNTCKKIDIAIGEVNKVESKEEFDVLRESIQMAIIDAVHSICDCIERISIDNNSIDDQVFFAFKYVNNAFKHFQQLSVFHDEINEKKYPYNYNYAYDRPCVVWSDIIWNSRSKSQRTAFEKELLNKGVIDSFKLVKKRLGYCLTQ